MKPEEETSVCEELLAPFGCRWTVEGSVNHPDNIQEAGLS